MGKIGKYLFFIIFLPVIFICLLIYIFESSIILSFPYAVMLTYFVFRISFRNDEFWQIKCVCYVGVGIITLVDESKAIQLVAVVAFIEAFDLFFVKCMKPLGLKIDLFLKELSFTIFGYNFI
jgi:hypothetical protein